MDHAQIWRAIDALAARHNLTPSGLARAAGLDPTTFNKSKRTNANGKARWPSTESMARALTAVGASFDEFATLVGAGDLGPGIPFIAMTAANAADFDEDGFPTGAKETVRFPGLREQRVYALEIAGDSAAPVLRAGDVAIVAPGAPVRRGDRVMLRLRGGEVVVRELGRRNDQTVEVISLDPAREARSIAAGQIEWIARILWASQ